MAQYEVVGVIAVVAVGDTEFYLRNGAIVPADTRNLAHLLEVGLVAEVDGSDADQPQVPAAAPDNASGSEVPSEAGDGESDGDDLDGIDRLDALRGIAEAEGVDVVGVNSKDGVRDAIRQFRASHSNL